MSDPQGNLDRYSRSNREGYVQSYGESNEESGSGRNGQSYLRSNLPSN